jgi:hypothetical protein
MRVFEMELKPRGAGSKVVMDGTDISALLEGVAVETTVNGLTEVRLHVARGQLAKLHVALPEAQVVIVDAHPESDTEN